MARKKAVKSSVPPTRERVEKALSAKEFATALDLARQLHAHAPTPEHLALVKYALATKAAHDADRDKTVDFNRVMEEAGRVDPADPAWAVQRACLLARGGRLSDAMALVDESARPKVIGQAADRAIRHRSKEWLPEEWHAGFDAIRTAFQHYEKESNAAAREALDPIGLRSPFLEWKVFLRGLLAHSEGDNARASENFSRLDPARLPARLAGPYRVAVDPSFKASLPADAATALTKQYEKLTTSPIIEGLQAIARDLGRDRPLASAFRAAESLLPHLKLSAPHLIPRLANCLYHALTHQGQPDDLPRYRRLFGSPPDDPNFHRLQALIGEQIGDPAMAHLHWQKYQDWLAGKPAGWSDVLLARARSLIWLRMGENAARAMEADESPEQYLDIFAPPRPRKLKLKPPADECFRQAAQLAPDWPDASLRLFDSLAMAKKPAEAEAAARTFLSHHPNDLPILTRLAALLQNQGRAEEAEEFWRRALALNPLDKVTRNLTSFAILGTARSRLIQGSPEDVDTIADRYKTLLEEEAPVASSALRSVAMAKLGRSEEAQALREKALSVPGSRLNAAFRMMVDSQLAKLKPVEKRAADKLFADELAKTPTPTELKQLLLAYDQYIKEGITYRGQKTQRKKFFDQVPRSVKAEAPESDFQGLVEFLSVKQEWKLVKKFADALLVRHPSNPFFLFARSEAGLESGERPYLIEQRLRRAKKLAEASAEPAHRALAGRIDELLKVIASPFDFLGSFFGYDDEDEY